MSSATPPPDQSPTQQQRPSYGYGPGVGDLARLPIPGNAELLVYALATILVGIVALASDEVNSGAFVEFFKWVTAAYLISRGIAKASRVLEH